VRKKGKWKEILVSKYYTGAVRNQNSGNRHSWWWRDLSKACDEGEGEGWFHKFVAWKVDPGIKSGFETMPGWTIISLNPCFPGCIPFPWIKERWWVR